MGRPRSDQADKAGGGGSPAKKTIVKKEAGEGLVVGACAAKGPKVVKSSKGAGAGGERKPQKYKIGQDVLGSTVFKGYNHMYRARIMMVREEFTKQGEPTWQYYVRATSTSSCTRRADAASPRSIGRAGTQSGTSGSRSQRSTKTILPEES